MTIHSTLVPTGRAAPPYAWPDLAELGSGGFASVRALSPVEVLKLTCCSASNAWLRQARRAGNAWPAAFPAVYESLGKVAVDADRIVFTGWRMERLFPLSDKSAAIAARSASIGQRAAADATATTRGVRPDADGLAALLGVVDACAVEPDEHWLHDAHAALTLASACEDALREGFLSLWAFIRRHAVKLDVAQRGNVLMDCFGRLRLADPLTMRLADSLGPPPAPRSWLAALLPSAQRGFAVTALWRAIPFSSPAAARDAAARVPALRRVRTSVCTATQAAQRLAHPPVPLSAFDFGRELGALFAPDLLPELFAQAQLR